MHEYIGSCPKCGHDKHFITNATCPTVHECCSCGFHWNPDNLMQDIVHAISTVLQVRVADLVKDESLATYPVYLTHKGGVYTAILRGGKPFDIGDQRVKDWQFSGVSQTDSRYSVWALFPRF